MANCKVHCYLLTNVCQQIASGLVRTGVLVSPLERAAPPLRNKHECSALQPLTRFWSGGEGEGGKNTDQLR